MTNLPHIASRVFNTPLMIDSTEADVIESALKVYPGRCIVNSVNLEKSGERVRKVLPLVKRYGIRFTKEAAKDAKKLPPRLKKKLREILLADIAVDLRVRETLAQDGLRVLVPLDAPCDLESRALPVQPAGPERAHAALVRQNVRWARSLSPRIWTRPMPRSMRIFRSSSRRIPR